MMRTPGISISFGQRRMKLLFFQKRENFYRYGTLKKVIDKRESVTLEQKTKDPQLPSFFEKKRDIA